MVVRMGRVAWVREGLPASVGCSGELLWAPTTRPVALGLCVVVHGLGGCDGFCCGTKIPSRVRRYLQEHQYKHHFD